MKKYVCVLICVVLILQACSCATFNSKNFQILKQEDDIVSIAKNTNLRLYYNNLNNEQKKLYNSMLANVFEVTDELNDNGYYPCKEIYCSPELTDDQIKQTYVALCNDNPIIFWVQRNFEYENLIFNKKIQLFSCIKKQDINKMGEEIVDVMHEYTDNIHVYTSEFEKELLIHDKLLERCYYDDKDNNNYNVYGALIQNKAVCEGYSKAMQVLLSYIGIKCSVVTGYSKGEKHMWNIVNLEGDWYNLDATWDDSFNINCYNYFNVPDDIMYLDHQKSVEFSNVFDIPKCSVNLYNYYNQKAVFINGFNEMDDLNITNNMLYNVNKGEHYISFKFYGSLSFKHNIDLLFNNDCKFFKYVDDVNKQLNNKHINNSSFKYITNENERAVTIYLEY